MNSYFFKADKDVKFVGRLNEDVNLYVSEGQRGGVCLTYPWLMLLNDPTQQAAGGATAAYRSMGTHRKSFYSVMLAPSAVAVGSIRNNGTKNKGKRETEWQPRAHHHITWNNLVPRIIDPKHRGEPK